MAKEFKTEVAEIIEDITNNNTSTVGENKIPTEQSNEVKEVVSNGNSEQGSSNVLSEIDTPKENEERTKRKYKPREKKEESETPQSGKIKGNSKDDFFADFKDFKKESAPNSTTTPNAPKPDVKIDLSRYITGALFLIAIDSILPSIVLKIASQMDAKYKNVQVSKLKLTAPEKKELEPLADEVVKLLIGYVHPMVAFLVVIGIMYFGKLQLLDDDDFEPKVKKKK